MKIYLVEIEGYNNLTLTTETLRFCTGTGFVTKPNENPPNLTYLPRVAQAGSITASMFANGATSGSSVVGKGEITLRNIDGAFDYLSDWGFDGRNVTVRRGEETGAYPSGFPIMYTATMSQSRPETSKFVFQLRDMQYVLDKPIQKLKFTGTNGPDGLEGTPSDIKDKFKPMLIGKAWNVTPVCVNTLKLIYALNIRNTVGFDLVPDIDAVASFDGISGGVAANSGVYIGAASVYDSGAALTKGADYTTEEEMNTQTPASGTYRVYPAGGYFRLGLGPTGALTVDCSDNESATTTAPTVANLIKSLLIQEAGVLPTSINQASLDTLNAANSSAVGFYATEETKFPVVFDAFCASVGAWYGFDRLGIFNIKQVVFPLSNPVFTINDSSSYEMLSTADTSNGVPASSLIMQWGKNYTVIKGTEVIGVPEARKLQLELESRETEIKDANVQVKHPLATSIKVVSAFYDDPTTEATRQFNIYKEGHKRYRVRVNLNVEDSEQILTLGNVGFVKLPRFGLHNGKNLMVIGYTLDCNNNWIDAILWG